MNSEPALFAKDVHTLVQRKRIVSLLRSRFDMKTTMGEIAALQHAEKLIHNPALFLSVVEPWYRRMLERVK